VFPRPLFAVGPLAALALCCTRSDRLKLCNILRFLHSRTGENGRRARRCRSEAGARSRRRTRRAGGAATLARPQLARPSSRHAHPTLEHSPDRQSTLTRAQPHSPPRPERVRPHRARVSLRASTSRLAVRAPASMCCSSAKWKREVVPDHKVRAALFLCVCPARPWRTKVLAQRDRASRTGSWTGSRGQRAMSKGV